jgi:hypothetical protein
LFALLSNFVAEIKCSFGGDICNVIGQKINDMHFNLLKDFPSANNTQQCLGDGSFLMLVDISPQDYENAIEVASDSQLKFSKNFRYQFLGQTDSKVPKCGKTCIHEILLLLRVRNLIFRLHCYKISETLSVTLHLV